MEKNEETSHKTNVLLSNFTQLLLKQIKAIFKDEKIMFIDPRVNDLLQKINNILDSQAKIVHDNPEILNDSKFIINNNIFEDDFLIIKNTISELRKFAPKSSRNMKIFGNIDKLILNCENERNKKDMFYNENDKIIEPIFKIIKDDYVNTYNDILLQNKKERETIIENEEQINFLKHNTQNQMKNISNKLRILGQGGLSIENPEKAEKVDKRAIRQIVDMNYVVNALNYDFLEKAKEGKKGKSGNAAENMDKTKK